MVFSRAAIKLRLPGRSKPGNSTPMWILRLCRSTLTGFMLSATVAPVRADLHFTEPVANAGVVYAGVPLTHEFIFENQGPETVTNMQARASCGCLIPHLAQTTFRAGEKGRFVLEVNTLSQTTGPHSWQVTLN